MIQVGYIHQGYPEKRNIIDVHHSELEHVKCIDVFKIADYLHFRFKSQTNLYYHNTFNDVFANKQVDVYHLFNMVNLGKKKWVSTFETMLPRYEPSKNHIRKAIEAMAADNCQQLIAMSTFNYEMQRSYLTEHFPTHSDAILKKTRVLFPPQKSLVTHATKDFHTSALKILFVGHDFFRKGGRELFGAVEALHQQGAEIHLTIISKLNPDSFITCTSSSDKSVWLKKITDAAFCTYHESNSNNEVMQLMKEHHLFAVPSLQETFGYVVLEAQACATPVLTTSIRAFPEINNDTCGWVVNIPQNSKGVADVATHGYNHVSKILQNGIEEKLTAILGNKESLLGKGKQALERIQTHHDPHEYAKRLVEIYKA